MTGEPPQPAGRGTPPEVQLGVLLRIVLWELDDVARDVGRGRTTPEQRAQVADNMEQLARLLRRVGSIDSDQF